MTTTTLSKTNRGIIGETTYFNIMDTVKRMRQQWKINGKKRIERRGFFPFFYFCSRTMLTLMLVKRIDWPHLQLRRKNQIQPLVMTTTTLSKTNTGIIGETTYFNIMDTVKRMRQQWKRIELHLLPLFPLFPFLAYCSMSFDWPHLQLQRKLQPLVMTATTLSLITMEKRKAMRKGHHAKKGTS